MSQCRVNAHKLVRDYQRRTTGTTAYHSHPEGLRFTDGMMYVAETCGAYWLLDAVASHQPDILRKHKCWAAFQVWRLRSRKDGTWLLDAWSDTPKESSLLVRQKIKYSDFPKELCESGGFQWFVMEGVAMLKEEY